MSQGILFSGPSIFDVMESQKRRLREELQHLASSELNDEAIAERVAREFDVDVPRLDEDRKYARSSETQVDVSRDPRRLILNRSRPFHLPGTELNIFIPFSGDPGVFKVRPSAFDMNPPVGEVVNHELCLTYRFVETPPSLTTECERTIAQVKKYLDWLRPSAEQLHSELVRQAQSAIDQRKRQSASHAEALKSLGIPLRDDQLRAAASPQKVPVPPTARPAGARRRQPAGWDVFISHASEDKEEIARPLANALDAQGLSVWYDEFSLKIGDSLRQSIDYGLLRSKFGVVILSPHFFEKHWPQQELNGLVTRELGGKRVVLPVWHHLAFDEIRQHSPILADRFAVSTDQGLSTVVQKILEAMW